jgi:hypothetical protein
MNISGVLGFKYPGQWERVLKAYDNSDLQTFLDTQVVWTGGNSAPTAAQFLLDEVEHSDYLATNALADSKSEKVKELKAEGLARIAVVMPAITDWDTLDLVREQFLSVAPAARRATATFQSIIDIFQAGKNAATAINGFATTTEVEAYDVVNSPSWP